VKDQGFCRVVQNCAYGRSRVVFMAIIKFSVLEKGMLMLLNSLFFLFVSKKKKRNKKLRIF